MIYQSFVIILSLCILLSIMEHIIELLSLWTKIACEFSMDM